MTTSPSRKPGHAGRPSWRKRLAQADVFGWSVAVTLVGMLGWLAWGVLTTNVGTISLPQVALPARNTPAQPVALDTTATVTSTAAPDNAPTLTATALPTVTRVPATTTPAATSAVPNGWSAGTELYITQETGYYANIFDPPVDPTQLQPGDAVTVQKARQRRGYYEWVEFEGDRWWFVDGWGWLPEDVLSETPPR